MFFCAAYKIMWVHAKGTEKINGIKPFVHIRVLQWWRAQRGGWIGAAQGSAKKASCWLST